MDFPEPLSSMLRNYDWNSITNPIDHRTIQFHRVPYFVKNNTGTIKVVGFINNYIKSANKYIFDLPFIINEDRSMSRDDTPIIIEHSNVYQLPNAIRNEMMLAYTFIYHLFVVPSYQPSVLINAINNMVAQNKTEYLKITMFSSRMTPLMMLVPNIVFFDAFIELIKYYTLDDLYYRDTNHQTVLDRAQGFPFYENAINNAIKEKELETFIYASENTGINAENIYYLAEHLKGGKKKSKRRHNKKRKTQKKINCKYIIS
jgi:hypothetical protein